MDVSLQTKNSFAQFVSFRFYPKSPSLLVSYLGSKNTKNIDKRYSKTSLTLEGTNSCGVFNFSSIHAHVNIRNCFFSKLN